MAEMKTQKNIIKWIHISVLACVVVMLQFGTVFGANTRAVSERLQRGVEAGELSQEQANNMMGVIKHDAVRERLQRGVEAGELSEDQVNRMMEVLEDRDEDEDEDEGELGKIKHAVEEFVKPLIEALKEKKISLRDAMMKWNRFQNSKIGPWLRHAVAEQKIDREEAGEFWKELEEGEAKVREEYVQRHQEEMKRHHQQGKGRHGKMDPEARKRFHEGLKRRHEEMKRRHGKMDPEAKKRFSEEMKRRHEEMRRRHKGQGHHDKKDPEARKRHHEEMKRRHKGHRKHDEGHKKDSGLEHIGKVTEKYGLKLKTAVDEGKLSEEDAWKKWYSFKEKKIGPWLRKLVASKKIDEGSAKEFWAGLEKGEAEARKKMAEKKGHKKDHKADRHEAKRRHRDHGKSKGHKTENNELKKIKATVEKVGKKIKKAFEDGKLSEEDAWKRWGHFIHKDIGPRLKKAVEQKKIKGEDALAYWKELENVETEVKKRKAEEEKAKSKAK